MHKITITSGVAFLLVISSIFCLDSDDGPFQLYNKATGFCLAPHYDFCPSSELRWTTGDRLLLRYTKKCLGAAGKTAGSGISEYNCDENSELQKWECQNETLLALKGHNLYMELRSNGEAVLTETVGPNTHLTIEKTTSGPCSRKPRVLYTIGGSAFGRPCMFPFMYDNVWYSDCTTADSEARWCAVETQYDHHLWGYCPTNIKDHWKTQPVTGERYQLNLQSALTWAEADASCRQQSSSLLSITDPSELSFITALLEGQGVKEEDKLWIGLTLSPEKSWHWSNGGPFRYLKWDSGFPLTAPGHNCALIDASVRFSWQSSTCDKKLGYICYSKGPDVAPVQPVEQGFCASPWIPYNGHCFHLHRDELKSWSEAQTACRREGGDLLSVRHVEDQSFVISQLGYASTDELWIGLNDRRTEGLFDWSDQSTVSFTSWESGEPSVSGTEDCVLMRGENGNWADRKCSEKHGYICMKPSASEATGEEVDLNVGCKPGWKKHGWYCYFVGTETKTFDEAKDDCKRSDSSLADVASRWDNSFFVSLVGMRPEKYFWLGLSNMKHIDQFVWTNSDRVRYTHWNRDMPGHRQGCVAMSSGTSAGLWDVLPCTNKEKYICKHLAEGIVTTSAPTTVPPLKCPEGWVQKTKNFCSKLFSGLSQKKTWFEARDYCRAIGGDLLSVHSYWHAINTEKSYVKAAWIGLSAPDSTGSYVWSDSSAVNYQTWKDGEPANNNSMESCVETERWWRYSFRDWKTAHCGKKNAFLCQIKIGQTPKPVPTNQGPLDFNTTSDGWIERNGHQYYFNAMEMSNKEARHFCQQQHADLLTINSVDENIFVWNQISSEYRSFWIGLSVDFDGTFQWMDGSPMLFQRWSKGQPNFKYYDENCGFMMPYTGYWHNSNCGKRYRSICKRSFSPSVNSTVAPTAPPKGGCKPNWKQFQSKCYNIIKSQTLKWENATQQCLSMNSKLASISSRQVEAFVLSQMINEPNTTLWIGFHSNHDREYVWTDGTPISYVNLYQGSWESLMYNYNKDHCVVFSTNPSYGLGKWLPVSCSDAHAYICQQDIDPKLPDATEPIPTDFVKIFSDSIKVVTKNLTWQAAQDNCENQEAQLASLHTEWTHVYVALQAVKLQAPVWIGMNTEKTSGYYTFTNGWHLKFVKWDLMEPSGKPCVYVDSDGSWKTAYCNETFHSVCMKSEDVPPTDAKLFSGVCPNDESVKYENGNSLWIPFKDHCYKFSIDSILWQDATLSCEAHGSMLVSIQDPAEQEFIFENVKLQKDRHQSYWIGLYQTHKERWLWQDKTIMGYSNWAENMPGTDPRVTLRTSDGKWETDAPWWRRPYICKTPKVLVQKPTPSPKKDERIRRTHGAVAAVVVIAALAVVTGVAFFLLKKSGHRIPIPDLPDKLYTFDNPLFFTKENSQPEDTVSLTQTEEVAPALVTI